MTVEDPKQGTSEFAPLAVASPIDDLDSIAPIILEIAKRDVVLAEFSGEKRLIAEDILQCASRLTSMTEWPAEHLLKQLGCELNTVGKFTEVDLKGLERCQSFMRLVTQKTGLVEIVRDRRRVVRDLARLLKATGGDVDRLDYFLLTPVERYTAVDLIRLGEIEAASDQVRVLAGIPGVGQEVSPVDPFAELPSVHISTARLDILIDPERRNELGVEVANYMERHIRECDGCRAAYEHRIAVLNQRS